MDMYTDLAQKNIDYQQLKAMLEEKKFNMPTKMSL